MTATIVSPRLMRIGGGASRQIAEVLGLFGLSRRWSSPTPGWCPRAPSSVPGAAGPPGSPPIFSDTVPDPTDTVIEAGVALPRAATMIA